ncbi:SH3 domain-containing protein [Roseovarius indicus]|uniref:SH3 domain-containing protein n=1 Tax=Roseovarius indicus TaxID=540747 RepID=UPI0032EDCCD1
MLTSTKRLTIMLSLLLPPAAALSQMDGHGPDAWQVTGVAPNDTLNVRTGPGTEHLVIGTFEHDATGLRMTTCVPFLTRQKYHQLTEAQRANLPPRWCLMESPDRKTRGWVSAHYLQEDMSGVHGEMEPSVAEAQALVRDLYSSFETASTVAANPFSPENRQAYFFASIAPQLSGRGADLLYDAQDFQGEVTRIAPDSDQPMLRGMITIEVDFTNWGQSQRAVFRLRADTARPGAPVRIFRIEHDGWEFP